MSFRTSSMALALMALASFIAAGSGRGESARQPAGASVELMGNCPPGFGLLSIDDPVLDAAAAAEADRNGDGHICVRKPGLNNPAVLIDNRLP